MTTASGTEFVGELMIRADLREPYTFNYSCSPDYSEAALGEVSAPNLGISRYDSQYYAVVLGTSGTRLDFAAHGGLTSETRNNVAPPERHRRHTGHGPTAQLRVGGVQRHLHLLGTLTFGSVPTDPSFLYSCTGDYTLVPLTG